MIEMKAAMEGAADVAAWLGKLGSGGVGRATSEGLNKTGLEFQVAQRRVMDRTMTLRRRDWVHRSVKFSHFANVRELYALIKIETPGDPSRSDILTQQEGGEEKRPQGSRLSIPDPTLTKGGKGIVPAAKRPRAFDFVKWGSKGGNEVFVIAGTREKGQRPKAKAADRIFMIKKPGGEGGIFQRTSSKAGNGKRLKDRRGARRMTSDLGSRGSRDANVRRLYGFTQSATLESRLHWVETAEGVVKARLSANLSEAMDKALAGGKKWAGGANNSVRRTARADTEGSDRADQWRGR